MSKSNYECPFEQELLMNLESGDIKAHIKEHIAGCSMCRETVNVHQWMNRFQQESMQFQMQGKKLPSADEIWDGAFTAPVLKPAPDKELVRKAMMPVIITQAIMYITILAGGLYLLLGNLTEVGSFFNNTLGLKSISNVFSRMLGGGNWMVLIYLVPVVGTMALLIYFIFTTDPRPKEKSS